MLEEGTAVITPRNLNTSQSISDSPKITEKVPKHLIIPESCLILEISDSM